MTHILCIETATDVCSVALAHDGEVIYAKSLPEDRRHSSGLVPLIEHVLAHTKLPRTSIDAVAISDGPGSYTGLRVGLSTAKGLCFALDCPLIAISSLRIIAHQALESAQAIGLEKAIYMPTIDARRDEVYAAIYDHNGSSIQEVYSFIYSPQNLAELRQKFDASHRIIICGEGAYKFAAREDWQLPGVTALPFGCDARYMGALAQQYYDKARWADLASHEPFYFKSPHITTPRKKI